MKFLTTALLGKLRGSIKGMTASQNKGGAYFMTKPIPTDPNSARQQAARGIFQSLAPIWGTTLTQPQRDAWSQYAANIVLQDVLGQDYTLSGFGQFMRSNISILNNGLPRVDDGPTVLLLPEVDPTILASASEATQLLSIAFDPLEQWVNEDDAGLAISMTLPRGEGREYLKGHERLAGVILGNLAAPLTSPQTLTAPFIISEDQKIEVSARVILADGRVSNPFRQQIVIAA